MHYTITPHLRPESKRQIDYKVSLVTTQPHFGGLRWWFACPNAQCGRRVSKLYRPPGEDYFLCRHCHNLVYRSSQEHDKKMDGYLRLRRLSPEALMALAQAGDMSAAWAVLEQIYRW